MNLLFWKKKENPEDDNDWNKMFSMNNMSIIMQSVKEFLKERNVLLTEEQNMNLVKKVFSAILKVQVRCYKVYVERKNLG